MAKTAEDVEARKARVRIREREALALAGQSQNDTTPITESIGGRFNKGLIDILAMPADLINAGLAITEEVVNKAPLMERFSEMAGGREFALPRVPDIGQEERQFLAEGGVPGFRIPDPEKPAEGITEHTMEIIGAGIIPHAGLTIKGSQYANMAIKNLQQMGVLKNMAYYTAARPASSAGGEVLASVGAGTGRTIAEENNASVPQQAMAELFGGLAPAAFIGVAWKASSLRYLSTMIKKHLFPYTQAGAWPRASKRVRGLSPDPDADAARIDITSDVPPARQTGNEKLLSLERSVMESSPAANEKIERTLNIARQALKDEMTGFFGGDPARPRELLKKAKQYLFSLVDLRAAKAANELEARLSRLDPDASPRDINKETRQIIGEAYRDSRKTEETLWRSIDSDAPVNLAGTRQTLADEIASRSRFDDPEDIPKWVLKALGEPELPPKMRAQLQQAGAIDSNGRFVPGMRQRLIDEGILPDTRYRFNDAKAIRSRLLQEIRAEQAKDAPNRNKIRILNNLANGDDADVPGILDDLAESGIDGVTEAREFSANLNDRFTRGEVGRLLGYDRTGSPSITPESTLDVILAGKDPATTIRQLIKAEPSVKPYVRDYLAAEFLGATDGGQNIRAAKQFIKRWERKGAFEIFPGLRDELLGAKSASEIAQQAGSQASKARSFAHKSGKSTTALYLDTDPGAEMAQVLNSKRPASNARKLYAKMQGDPDAQRGLRTQFIEEGFARSNAGSFHPDGSPVYSGKKFTKFLDDNKAVAESLGVSDADWRRLEDIALRMRQLEAKPGGSVGGVLNDKPAAILDLIARWVGARQGGRLGDNIGSSLVLAGAFADRVRKMLERLTAQTGTQMLIDAHSDPKLYKSLLTRPDAPIPKQEKAAQAIQSWLVGVGATTETEE